MMIAALAALAIATPLGAPDDYRPTAEDIRRAEAFLAAHGPTLPDDWRWGTHASPIGPLRWGQMGPPPASAPATVAFVPGYQESIEVEGALLQRIADRGFRVVAMDLPGQGGSVRRETFPQRPFADGMEPYETAIRDFVAARKAEAPARPLVVVANSFGAHATFSAARGDGLEAEGLVLLMPAFEAQTEIPFEEAAYAAIGLVDRIGYGHRRVPGEGPWQPDWTRTAKTAYCRFDPETWFFMDSLYTIDPELRAGGVTLGWVHALERSGRALAEGEVPNSTLPALPTVMVTGGRDRVVRNGRTEAICERMERCRLLHFPDARHCVVLEPSFVKEAVVDAIAALPSK